MLVDGTHVRSHGCTQASRNTYRQCTQSGGGGGGGGGVPSHLPTRLCYPSQGTDASLDYRWYASRAFSPPPCPRCRRQSRADVDDHPAGPPRHVCLRPCVGRRPRPQGRVVRPAAPVRIDMCIDPRAAHAPYTRAPAQMNGETDRRAGGRAGGRAETQSRARAYAQGATYKSASLSPPPPPSIAHRPHARAVVASAPSIKRNILGIAY